MDGEGQGMIERITVLVVGGGKGGQSFVDLLSRSRIVRILAVVDIDPQAPGVKLARVLGIPVDNDYRKYLSSPELNEIINVTGSDEVQRDLLTNVPPHVKIIDGYSGKFIWSLLEEQRGLEHLLRENEERFRIIFDTALDPIFIKDSNGRYLLVNRAMERLLGSSLSEIIGKTDEELFGAETGKHILKSDADVLLGEIVEEEDTKPIRGVLKTFNTIKVPIWSSLGKVVGLCGIERDVTERKHMEEDLRQSETKYRELFENASDMIFTVDLSGCITSGNRAVYTGLGYSADEFLTKSMFDILVPESAPEVAAMLQKAAAEQSDLAELQPWYFELLRKDGVRIEAEIRTRLIWQNGRITGIQGIARDITERRRAEEILKESERLQKATIESTADGILVVGTDGKVLLSNRRFAEMWRIPEEMAASANNEELITFVLSQLQDPQGFLAKTRELLGADRECLDFVYFSDRRVFERYSSPMIKEGRLSGRVWSFRDITERKTMEENLRIAQRQMKDIIEFLPDPTFVIANNGIVIAWNQAMEEMTGVKKGEILGKGDFVYAVPFYGEARPIVVDCIFGQEDAVRKNYASLEKRGNKFYAEAQAPRLYSGRGAYVAATASPLFDDKGIVIGAIESIRDITQQKKDEQDLWEARKYLENMFQYANAPIIVWDPNFIVSRFNQAAEFITGYAAAEIIGRELHMLFPETSRQDSLDKIARTVGGEYWISVEIPIRRKDGGIRTLLWNSANIYAEGSDKLLVTIAQGTDITERKKMEEALRKAHDELEARVQERTAELMKSNDLLNAEVGERKRAEALLLESKKQAEAANRIKSAFLANMSHEIRTPLNAITGFSELLESTALDYVQKDYVSVIRESGNILLALINDILDLSKIEAGEMHLEHIDFDLEYLIRSVIKINSPKLEGKSIELFCAIDEHMPKNFKGDPTRVRQILINLLSNAIKFTEEGSITISVRPLDPAAAKDTFRIIEFSVRDTGIGISAEKHERIFDAFEQADTSTTRKYGGTGLGLTICKGFVEMMGGAIRVVSEPGKGSEFIFTVRLEETMPIVDKEIAPVRLEELRDKKVLIVDDSETARRVIEDYCLDLGMNILFKAASANVAWEWLMTQTGLPDIIISDIVMQGMSGYDFASSVREDGKFKHIKMIAVTTDIRPGAAKKAQMAGFDAYLPKPVIKGDFARIVQTTLGDNRRNKKEEQIVTRHMAEELACKGFKILLAEDNAVNQKLLQIVLKNLGCDADIASNGQIAVEKARSNRYDLVLMDLQMPVMGGCEATRIIRAEIDQTMPIIALTAAAMKEDEENSLAAGMNDYITKPVELHKLKEKIIQWGKRSV